MMFMGIPPLALTGAVFGAFLSGVFYRASHGKIICAVIGEIFGTGTLLSGFLSCNGISYGQKRTERIFLYTNVSGSNLHGRHYCLFLPESISHAGMLAKFQQSLGARVYDRKANKTQAADQVSPATDTLHH